MSYLFISFLTELGRYYLRSRNDKNDINLRKIFGLYQSLKNMLIGAYYLIQLLILALQNLHKNPKQARNRALVAMLTTR